MSQACEKCCGKLIPGPHQLAGVWITCAAGKPHSAPPYLLGDGVCGFGSDPSLPPGFTTHTLWYVRCYLQTLFHLLVPAFTALHTLYLGGTTGGEPLDLIPIGLLSLLTSFLDRGLFDHCACAMDVSARAAPFSRIRWCMFCTSDWDVYLRLLAIALYHVTTLYGALMPGRLICTTQLSGKNMLSLYKSILKRSVVVPYLYK